jgi:hypothetical protein
MRENPREPARARGLNACLTASGGRDATSTIGIGSAIGFLFVQRRPPRGRDHMVALSPPFEASSIDDDRSRPSGVQ